MKQILFVDDDPVIVEIYRRKFVAAGFELEAASDGLAAMKRLTTTPSPDLVVLDLMMPRMNGVDVLKFMRGKPDLKSTPVIILANSFMNDMAQAAALAGADRALLKSRCPPALLLEAVNELLSGQKPPQEDAAVPASADHAPTIPGAANVPAAGPSAVVAEAVAQPVAGRAVESQPAPSTKLRDDFVQQAPATLKNLRGVLQAFLGSPDDKIRQLRLGDLYRKIHFLTSMAGIAGCEALAQFASALEALLFELQEKPTRLTSSTQQTISQSVDFIGRLFEVANCQPPLDMAAASVMVVDDDVISNRLMVAALHRVQFKAVSESNPVTALQKLSQTTYDLVLLDISMPSLDGFSVCTQLRQMPAYATTPIIFVTGHTDFENRSRSVLSGGNDVIAKPILPIELAVKVLTHLLGVQLDRRGLNREALNPLSR